MYKHTNVSQALYLAYYSKFNIQIWLKTVKKKTTNKQKQKQKTKKIAQNQRKSLTYNNVYLD